ncbi:MAG: N-acetylmuramoyl-L-alanine amidase [Rhodospirillales bacterium]|nr:N-acetylmuramoyl-L-alanine amidase [Alphaproteobacteria bacterium]MBL6929464.1 N-acetylmuramoyl-L-alanine amidase [Rhodospirillales bacterium]
MWRMKAWSYSAAIILSLLVVGAVFWNSAAAAGSERAVVSDVRVADHGIITRFVLDMTRPIRASIFTLADPYRVVLDLPEVGWRLPAQPLPQNVGLYKKVRYGLFKPGTTRVVIEATGPIALIEARYFPRAGDKPVRLVLDMAKTTAAQFRALAKSGASTVTVSADSVAPTPVHAAPAAPAATPAARPALVSARFPFSRPPRKPEFIDELPLVVIDPGHGGADPGTSGVGGTYEKHITLSAAREFRRMLEKTGRYRVVLTRDRDTLIALRDRVTFAREIDADLFISLHADSIRKKNIRGLSVYTLSERASDSEAGELAERENKADLIAGIDLSNETPEVTNILIDLAQRETMNESARFAAVLVKELGRQTRLLRNSHRFAGFRVLKAPDVPSVLLEMGFLSNRADEKELLKKSYRAKLGAAFVHAVDKYFSRVEEAYRR